jgi:hypothetical protein
MPRALIIALAALSACSFRPRVPTGTISCQTTAECPTSLTCQPAADPRAGRRCCGAGGCPVLPADAAAAGADAALSPPSPEPTPVTEDAGAANDGPVVVAPADAAPVDAAAPDKAPVNAAALVTCTPPVTGPLPTATGRRSYCSVGILDRVVLLGVDTIDGQDESTASTVQSCAAPLDLAGKTRGGTSPLSADDLDVLAAIVRTYQGLCTQLKVDEVVGLYAGGWARQVPNADAIKSALQSGGGLDMEVLTADQEVLQRYLGASRNRRGRLVVHARGTDLQAASWVNGATGPTELTVAANLPRADAMFFTSAQVTSYQDGRRQYADALRMELDTTITSWRQQMNQGRLDRSLTADTDDATLPLAMNGNTLRSGNGTWTDVATWKKSVADAPIMASGTYGRSFDVIAFRDLTRFVSSIDDAQFEQLRSEPIHSAYGLQVMGQGAIFEVLVRDLPITEMGIVPSSSSLGYLFRKRFTPR